MGSGAVAAGRPASAAVDRYLPSARRSAANPQHAASASNDGTDRRADGRTPERYTEPVPHTMRAVPIIDVWKRCKKLRECVQYRMHETANT